MMTKVALVTGGSSGIGLCAARTMAEAGLRVYILSRKPFSCDNLIHLCGDVSCEESVRTAIRELADREGRIDILVNCAGFGISGAVEFTEHSEAQRQMDVNFFGTVNATKAVLPIMRKQESGRIINVSSVAAPVAIPFQAYYSASKAAINAYTCALANELRPYGISVCSVQPGDIRTGFTDAREKSHKGDDVYGGRISRSVSKMERDEKNGMPPEKAGKFIRRIALKKRIKPIYTIGFSYKCICFLCKILPCGLLNRIVGILYAK